MDYFFDTSAIVKVYHEEEGSNIILPIYNAGDSILVSEISKVEFLSTIHKKFRSNEINTETLEALKARFLADTIDRFIVIPIVSNIVEAAIDFIEKYGKSIHLFSLDAIQIATFSVISDNNTTFVCADKRLISLVNSLGYRSLSL